jgi:hypothetical protein
MPHAIDGCPWCETMSSRFGRIEAEVLTRIQAPIVRPKPPINTQPLFPLGEIWPDVVERLKNLLLETGELSHAATLEGLQVYDRCRCGSDDCATVYTTAT